MSGFDRAALALCLFVTFTMTPPSAWAQDSAYDPNRYLTEKDVQKVHDLLQKTLPPGPPVSIADARKVLTSAVLSAIADKCGLQWQRQIYLPMMTYFRHDQKLTEPQMAVLGAVHGIHQSFTLRELAQSNCSGEVRDQISRAVSDPS